MISKVTSPSNNNPYDTNTDNTHRFKVPSCPCFLILSEYTENAHNMPTYDRSSIILGENVRLKYSIT